MMQQMCMSEKFRVMQEAMHPVKIGIVNNKAEQDTERKVPPIIKG
jgi:hypothetical protein